MCQRLVVRIAALALAALTLAAVPGPARAIETNAREAVVLDYATGTVLFAKHARRPMPPASMTKLMTAYVVFDRLSAGELTMQDTFRVSEKAWRKGGSKMFVEVGKEVSVENLLQGMLVQSGNDAAIVLAEGVAGSEAAFTDLMNAAAKRLNMPGTHFANANGWPNPKHRTSALGLARLARAIIQRFPDYYHRFFSQRSFTWNGIRQANRNPLLGKLQGVDGLKTGYTRNAGYGLTASAERNGRRVITVVNGLKRPEGRGRESARLISWAFRTFKSLRLFAVGETVDRASVWMGAQASIPLVSRQPVWAVVPTERLDELMVRVRYESPIPAPVDRDTQLATLEIEVPGRDARQIPLFASKRVEEVGTLGRVVSSLQYLLTGFP
ncbi:D-alanyl-D-alanine carboxypeptidase family protein [Rhodovibrio salinarum]|uniref:serine-type D-Ala-D-Ala carboxypeptidase n=1 Tax=Rhodovibrio salinarum TaxID=1087 RepID=A0A934QKG4_9PROT|nr:D-alanyl-D-alanine carboxypeptidase family protein [Rhodovibrio salinarum]MBK1698180.1 D-alanyl-D-alanine carboxypeptidase [Rhodovibrio salinarum]